MQEGFLMDIGATQVTQAPDGQWAGQAPRTARAEGPGGWGGRQQGKASGRTELGRGPWQRTVWECPGQRRGQQERARAH